MSSQYASDSGSRRAERLRLLLQPVAVLAIVGSVLGWAFSQDLDEVTARSINATNIVSLTWQHFLLSLAVAVIVVVVAVPMGVLLSRPWARRVSPVVIGIANVGQAAPSVGLLVLFFLATKGSTGFWIAVLPIAVYALLPVLRNTMVGLQQVDRSLVDAGRGIGMSAVKVLLRIELPLSVPYILAGLRTALVLAVGTATLALFVGAGGLGELIDTGYKLNNWTVMCVGSVLAMALALLVDWLAALAEEYLSPRGLR
ncbi:osmoprotectant transport system permease protein [Saccharopolyspora erythraea NRRL 2338]|uniref:ABC transporter permease n=2 Tax=Saccharopolyspora erythraea TaxID=1836 RepID=A0ABP3P4L8_SACER|nr:ABC transporter permease [Saccharopolyspora erythraea]EQD84211.1 ABC transporter permease [Saccharopolyspora erythraea D]PFG93231.1 osmoprotectant transport system permease protein [Saccharopolyspora erythraea NRRL 2338]QRK90085.1 ABC transporter permease [Saccharopolyspora erythraea]CAL99432.1 probable ABC quaternary amine transporter,permease component [Saccharopolyspora erythraea NRRL 2338]